MFTIKVSKEDFEKIKSGSKNQECMAGGGEDIFVGDHILFKKKPDLFDGVLTKVVDKKIFSSLEEMTTIVSFKNLGFEDRGKNDVVNFYEKLFDKSLIDKHGVIVYKFELV